jgi:hypothetical protein
LLSRKRRRLFWGRDEEVLWEAAKIVFLRGVGDIE